MSASVATLFYAVLILGLFWLNREHGARTSAALWLPVLWLFFASSRSASEWLYLAPPVTVPAGHLESDPINRVVYSCLVALALLVLAFRGPKTIRLLQANGLILLFLFYCVSSLLWADYPDVAFKRWIKLVGDFLMVLIVVSDPNPSAAIRRLLMRTGFILIPLSVLMIKYYPDLARYYSRWDWAPYYSGATTNKNTLGAVCLLFGLASAWQFIAALSGRDRLGRVRRLIAHGTILAMVMWLFKLANSMTALSCFLIGLAVLLVLGVLPSFGGTPSIGRRLFDRMMMHWLVMGLVAVPAAVLFFGQSTDILKTIGRDPTLTDRTMIWDLVLAMTPNTWIGTGFENFWLGKRLNKIWGVYSWGPNQAHNGYIEIYLNLGSVGVALLLVILAAGYMTALRGIRNASPVGGLMLAYFVVGVVFNFTEAAFFRMTAPAWIALLLALTRVPELGTAVMWRAHYRDPAGQKARLRSSAYAGRGRVSRISRNA